ncbi:hypothetical protein CRD13_03445 [Corynebacterium sp. LK26]|nr:hypothetical protein [Corynebacterium sp. LK26]
MEHLAHQSQEIHMNPAEFPDVRPPAGRHYPEDDVSDIAMSIGCSTTVVAAILIVIFITSL